ncbi:DNA-methyltransferase [Arthrobacter caoxuetaonis]|uniref:Methyltransferase n=1 Tax=Arthrobacter caoxuetaonis TaxID=2886935 RepID=A0A9X1SCS1_9MICC|nr:site-specific DNA-methyltransferase [Arthrobacter caoxuetaonis]MCC3298468.1 site-specific DNA-methyltransferase [Arthrobacter caoxuetaonis]USQ57520.1 site-specific DNA-methyltransferase [Arthrobacter caoxuetaonis]
MTETLEPLPMPSRQNDLRGWTQDFEAVQSGVEQVAFLHGDSLQVLASLPDESVDMMMTSPPYWGQRKYESDGIGAERSPAEFIDELLAITRELHRVLKSTGSFWLNIGDSYVKKALAGVPWRLAIKMIDEQGWVLRNEVVWNKLKGGMDQSRDRLANTHELIFHFVKRAQGYYYDVDAIRTTGREAKVVNGAVVSATGVSGIRYRRQIELSTVLTEAEKQNACQALEAILRDVAEGRLSDFRMVIRGQQRVTHSDQAKVSGRAKELIDKGFYFLRYHPKGTKPSDVWDILPEDTQARGAGHFAVYPVELCLVPILASCPPDGIVLDPFCGTGTTMVAASQLGRRSVGIDLSANYLQTARNRIGLTLW